jgi:uncharacterized alpha-E superfamily protein
MLLSSVAEAMFWSGRYLERARALARAIQSVERLSLDLPGKHALGLRPLLALVGDRAELNAPETSQAAMLHALALNQEDPSSVLGALGAARENLRQARVVAPPELWLALNNQYHELLAVAEEPMPRVLEALGHVLEVGSRISGVIESSMARDETHSFLSVGVELERADMLLRVLAVLLPALAVHGWERTFDDVRWGGLLSALGVHSMYRRRHHHQVETATLLDFLAVDMASPRSVAHCLRRIEDALRPLPRAAQVLLAVALATSSASALARANCQENSQEIEQGIDAALAALAAVHESLQSCYFPESVTLRVIADSEPSASNAR